MNWIDSTVGEFCPFIYGKSLPKSKRKAGNVPVYGSNGQVDSHNESYVMSHGIIIGRKGSIGVIHLCEEPFWPIDTTFYVEKESIDELRFTYYLLNSLGLEHMNSDSAVPGLNRENAHSLKVKIPEKVGDREALGAWIAKFDKKIELNRQINQTLEAISQAIFKSWFVDFEPVKAKISAIKAGEDAKGVTHAAMSAISGKTNEELDQLQAEQPEHYIQLKNTAELFPAAIQDSELGEIPEGWRAVDLKEMSKTISKGTTPSKKQITDAEGAPSISFIKVKDIADDGQINRAGLELIHESIHKGALKRSIISENDLLFSIAGTIGRVSIVENDLHDSNINQAIAFIRLNRQEHLSLVLEHLKSKRIQEFAIASVVQGVQANVSLAIVGSFQIVVPKDPLLAAWNNVALSLHTEKLGRQKQNRLLSQLRDTLLPKLLSGELSVDAAKLAEEKGLNYE